MKITMENVILAAEFGFRGAEKGWNLERTLRELQTILSVTIPGDNSDEATRKAVEAAKKISKKDEDALFQVFMDGFGDGQESDMFYEIMAGQPVALPTVVDLMDTLAEWKKEKADRKKKKKK